MRNPILFLFVVFIYVLSSSLAPNCAEAQGKRNHRKRTEKKEADPSTIMDAPLKAAIATAPKSSDFPNSNAVRLLDLCEVTMLPNGGVFTQHRTAYKLFNARARRLAEVTLPYNSSYEAASVRSARTVKKNGTIVPVKVEDFRVSSPGAELSMYDDEVSLGFSLPSIEDDCIIDYSWETISVYAMMPGQYFSSWSFQGEHPVKLSRLTLTAPSAKQIKFKIFNDDELKPKISASKNGKEKVWVFERRDLKPVTPEIRMPSAIEILPSVQISTISGWDDIAKWFWKLQQPQAKATAEIKKTVVQLIANCKNDEEKARTIYDWVAGKTRYVGLEFGISAYEPHSAKEVFDKRYGDCKDKATLLITMLSLAGIKSSPALLHSNLRIDTASNLPQLSAFNHCIALAIVSGKEVWLDATSETCAYGDIPGSDRGVHALVVSDGKGEFKTVPSFQFSENGISEKIVLVLKEDGTAEIEDVADFIGNYSQSLHALTRSYTPEQKKQFIDGLASVYGAGSKVSSFTLPPDSEKSDHFTLKLKAISPNKGEITGKLMLISPRGALISNPYSLEKREYPIQCDTAERVSSQMIFNIPNGYVIDQIPEKFVRESTTYKCSIEYQKSSDGKSIVANTSFEQSVGSIPAKDYKVIKDFYDDIVKLSSQKIILRKSGD